MRPGDAVGFGGDRDAHQLVNCGAAPARYLEVGGAAATPIRQLLSLPDDDAGGSRADGDLHLHHQARTAHAVIERSRRADVQAVSSSTT